MLLANFNGKEHLRHRAVSLRQHGFLVLLTYYIKLGPSNQGNKTGCKAGSLMQYLVILHSRRLFIDSLPRAAFTTYVITSRITRGKVAAASMTASSYEGLSGL